MVRTPSWNLACTFCGSTLGGNDSGELAAPTLRYLDQIGAAETASVLRRAVALFPDANVPPDLDARRELLEEMEDRGVSFDTLTDELFSCGEDVNELHGAYAKTHPALFARIWRPAR